MTDSHITPSSATGPEGDPFTDFANANVDEGLASKLVQVAEATPGLVEDTRSNIDPASLEEAEVALVRIVLDNSWSIERLLPILGASHDEFIRALYPAARENVAVLVTAVLLDGTVLYPFTRVKDVPLFGKPEIVGDPRNLNGYNYSHMRTAFPLFDSTPLRLRMQETASALMTEAVRFENPEIARQVNMISVVITDGLDNDSDELSVTELSELMEEMDDQGNFVQAAMYLGKVPDIEDRIEYLRELKKLIAYLEYYRILPKGFKSMDLKELLTQYFGAMGVQEDRVFLPGDSGRAIRAAIGQVSQLALQASQGAFRKG